MARSSIKNRQQINATPAAQVRRRRSLNLTPNWGEIELEQRQLLATVTWDGGAGTWNWADRTNWSGDLVPTTADDVIIPDLAGVQTILVNSSATVLSINSAEGLTVQSGNTLTVTAGNSTVSGAFTAASGATLNAMGLTQFSATSNTVIDGATLYAQGGAKMNLSKATSYTNTAYQNIRYIRATGLNSSIDLSGVNTITNGSNYYYRLDIEALSGGKVDLKNVVQIVDPTTGDSRYRSINVKADGVNSVIDFSALQSFQDVSNYGEDATKTWPGYSSLTVSNSGTVISPQLQSLGAVAINHGVGSLDVANVTSVNSGQINISSGTVDYSRLVSLAGTAFSITGGSANLPIMTDLTNGGIKVTGGSLNIPKLTNVSGATIDINGAYNYNFSLVTNIDGASVFATGGAKLAFPVVTQYTNTAYWNIRYIRATGLNSSIDLSGVNTITNGSNYYYRLDIEALSGGKVDLKNVVQIVDPTTGDSRYRSINVKADGVNSVIDFSALQSFQDVSNYGEDATKTWPGYSSLTVSNSGTVISPQLQSLGAVTINHGVGSLDVANVTSVNSGQINITSGSVNYPKLTSLMGSLLKMTGGNLSVPKLATIQNSTIDINSPVNYNFANVTNIDSATILATGGANLTFPLPTTYTNSIGATTIQASGDQSSVNLPALIRISNSADYTRRTDFNALAGGMVNLSAVQLVTDPANGDTRYRSINMKADGLNSQINLNSLVSYQDVSNYGESSTSTWPGYSTISAVNDGKLILPSTGFILRDSGTVIYVNNSSIKGKFTLRGGAGIQAQNGGYYQGNITNDGGVISPGASAGTVGTLTIDGNYTQTSTGVLNIEVNGTTPGTQYDQLVVTGTATLAGRLNVSAGFTPSVGNTFQFLQAGSITGDFQVVSLPTLSGGVALTKTTGATDVTLNTIAAPVIAIADTYSDEGDTAAARSMAFVISGTAPTGGATINYTTTGGNAGVDYTVTSGNFTVPAGVYSKTINVPILANKKLQADRTFQMQASATGVTPVTGNGLIYDDDAPVTLTLANATASSTVNTLFTPAISATVKNKNGSLVEGATVNLGVIVAADGSSASFAGNATASSAISNANGVVTVPALTANSNVGGPYSLSFSGLGSSGIVVSTATMSLSNMVAIATSLAISSGNNQSASANTAFAQPLKAKALDTGGNGVAGVTITFAAPASGATGAFAGGVLSAVTGADGVAVSPVFTANTVTGNYVVTASASGLAPVGFNLSNIAGPPASVTYVSGSGQYASLDTNYLNSLKALVRDAFGNPVAGATVSFSVPGSGASVAFAGGVATTVTDASGVAASAVMKATGAAGAFVVTASVAGVSTPASFNLQNTTGPIVLSLTPTGLTNQNVSVLRAVFSEPMNLATFTGEDVKITLPGGGTIPFANISVAAVAGTGNTTFDISISEQSGDGKYDVEVGPAIAGVAGVSMTVAKTQSFTIDKTAPTVQSTDPSAEKNTTVSSLDITFSETLRAGTLNAADIVLKDPAGNVIPVGEPVLVSGNTYRFAFTQQRSNGVYTVKVGPAVLDLAGNAMVAAVDRSFTVSLADLGFSGAATTSVNTAKFGDSLDVSWALKNLGTAATAGNWTDRVYLSTDNTYSANDILLKSVVQNAGALAPNGQRATTTPVTLPLQAGLAAGNYYLIVRSDADNALIESNEANNVAASASLTITVPPLPDLKTLGVTAPASALPGSKVNLAWQVTNAGAVAAAGDWVERVYLSKDNAIGGDLLLAAFGRTGQAIAAGASVNRAEQVQLPANLDPGDWYFVVEVDSANAVAETDEGNNLAISPTLSNVPVLLTLTAKAQSLQEDGAAITGRVTRSGNVGQALVVSLASSNTGEATVPPTVTIPAGFLWAEFPITPVQDNVLDGDKQVSITGRVLDGGGQPVAGYADGSVQVSVLDSASPTLSLQLLTSTVREGNSVTGRLTRSAATVGSAVVVTLEANFVNQLGLPATVTIPAGSVSADFTVMGLLDEKVEISRVIQITASGPALATANLTLTDANDASLIVTTSVPTVQENAQGVAAIGTVTRPVAANRPQLVKLTADAGRLLVPAFVTIPAGAKSVQFQIATVDNTISGDTAGVVIQALPVDAVDGVSTVAPGGQATLTVVDDDAAGLVVTIKDILISEGDNVSSNIPAAIGVVRRNSADTSQQLTVLLSSSNTSEARVNASVTIEANASSANFPIYSVWDGVPDGTKQVTITASAPGMNSGSAVISVTDIDKPDLRVPGVSGPGAGYTGQPVSISYSIFNQGPVATPGGFTDRIYLSDDAILDLAKDTLVATRVRATALGGQTDDFVNSFGLTLPVDKVGKYYFLVQTDALKQVDEVFEENNVGYAAQPTVISAAYSATVSAGVAQAAMGTPVVLSGKAVAAAAGISVAGVPVSVLVTQDKSSIRRVLKATTDSLGNYSVTFTPFASEAGVYRVAAQHPAISADLAQATFKLLGMSVQPDAIGTHVTEGQTATGTFDVKNLTDVPLTGMAWAVVGAPANLEVTVTPPSLATLAGDGAASFSYSIKALNTSVQAANFTIRLSSAEGAVLDVPATVRVDALTALLQGPAVVKSPMVRNTLRTVEFTVTNPSGLATGPIRMLFSGSAPWLSVANASVIDGVPVIASVPANGSATVSLLLNPGASLALGSYSGQFVMVPESGPSLKVNYQFESVSVATGDLVLKVYDELVNLDTGLPLAVAGAKVELLNVFTGEVVATGTADSQGAAGFSQVTEGFYNLRVSADNHDSSLGTVEVKAGVASDQIVVLRSRQVRYNWSVVPVPYEDRYQVQIESLFTTNVPAPVITISPGVIDLADPKFADGYEQVDFVIANHGLVAAKDMTFTFDTMGSTLWKITPLVEDIGQLPARSEITVPVIVQMIGDPNICSNICSFSGALAWDVVSFDRKIPFQIPIPVLNADDCCVPNTWEPVFAGGGGGGGFDGILYPIDTPPAFNFVTPIEVDAAVKLHLDQTAVMTRTAFDATLEIGNNLNVPLDGLQVQIMVTAADTGEVVSDRFAIGAAALSNITVDASGLWSVPAKSAGKSTWKLLPTDLAAPLKDTQYNVGGTFSYVVNGQRVVTPMKPALITVKPDAVLQVTYFHQVDVYADDPWTPELEPSVPYDLGVMVTNVGAGTANSLTITSGQPKIVENEKGLLIDFQIVGAQVNDQPVEKSLTVNFGDVAPGTTEVGRWQLTSTLQGQFTSYEATFQHLTGLGDPRTSLIKSVKILPLIHTVKETRAGADTLPDFLTDEVSDTYHTPDTIHLSNGQILPVGLGTATSTPAAPRAGAMSVNFNANMPAGFGYLRLIDPNTDTGAYKLVGVKRADGSFIALGDNVWTTNRTFTVPFQRPIVENSIHILDAVGSASYSLVYASTDVTGPTVTAISAVVPNPATVAIDALDVTFSEPIDPTSFTTADLSLKVNGVAVSTAGLTITAADSTNTVFHVTGLTSLTSTDAQYDFSVNTPGVTDIWGNAGTGTAVRTWVKAATSLAIANVAGVPSEPTRTAPFKVTVQFNRPVAASSFDFNDLTLTRNGGANLITGSSGVSFNVLDSQTVDFYLPVDLTATEGTYALTIAATGVNDSLGLAGVGLYSQTWNLDKTAPVLLPLEPIATNPRNTVVQSAKVTFSEPIDPASFTTANVRLLRGTSSTNLLDFRFSITQLSPTEFLLDGINWPQGTEGDYTLSVDSAGVLDPARNLATGAQSVTWRLDLTAPLPPTNFAITPDLGISNTDMITSTGEVALLGKASEAWGRVKFEDDQTGKDLGYTVLNGSRDYIFPTVLGTGMHKIKVVEVDLAGNFSDPAFMYVKIDQTSAAANALTQEPRTNTTELVHYVDVTFTKPINVATFTVSALGLTRDGVPVDLSSATITSITATTYRIGNLGGAAATTGLFSLSLNTASIYDQAGNAGAGLLKSQWQVQVPAVLAIVTGDSQSTSVGNSFNIPLTVRLTDTAGNPIPGILVTFAAPGSGASALFAGGLTTSTTNANGEAASAALKANSVIGTYSVTATAAGLAPTIFTLTNAAPELASFTVQKGSVGRSFVRYVDLAFNTTATLGDIVASIGTGSPRIRMTNTGLDGTATLNYSLANKIAAVDAVLAMDFGLQGIGGDRNAATGDGSYLIEMDLDGNGSFETSRRFFRLLGDVNGDKVVDGLDANIVAVNIGATGSNVAADINGDGVVNAADTLLVRRQKGRKITI